VTRLPILNAKTIEKVLVKLGFEPVRQKGSHVFYRHPDGRTTTVPFHAGTSPVLSCGRSLRILNFPLMI
jgi:predicted RNA binding protein YcfA (HicA-like mRNA interferase family)